MILPPAYISYTNTMKDVIDKFDSTGAWNLPVIDNAKYIGIVSKSKLFLLIVIFCLKFRMNNVSLPNIFKSNSKEMKIAVPTRNNIVDDHFGHCEYYTIFTINGKEIKSSQVIESPEGCGCKSNIAGILHNDGVSVMLAGNMGAGAQGKLNAHGINVVRGCSGDVNELVKDYLDEKISDSGESCEHHSHHH